MSDKMTREEAAQAAWEIAKANGFTEGKAQQSVAVSERGRREILSIHISGETGRNVVEVGETYEECLKKASRAVESSKLDRIASLRAELAKLEGGQA